MTAGSYLCALVFAAVLVRGFAPGVLSRGKGLERKYLPYLVLELSVDSEGVFQGDLLDGEPGEPHEVLRKRQGLEPGEYLRWLEQWSWEGEHLTRRVRGTEYEIYCVPAAGEVTRVPIPVGYDYRISGNGADRFVVTVWKKKGPGLQAAAKISTG